MILFMTFFVILFRILFKTVLKCAPEARSGVGIGGKTRDYNKLEMIAY